MPDSYSDRLEPILLVVLLVFGNRRHPLLIWLFVQVRWLVFSFRNKPSTQVDSVCLAMAEHIFHMTNKYRRQNGLSQLKWNKKLYRSSLYHARRMRETGEFEHVLSDGVDIGDRLKRYGFAYREVRENLYLHTDFLGATPRRMARTMMKGWIKSPGHKANLDTPSLTHLGVAVVYSERGFYAVQNFGTPIF